MGQQLYLPGHADAVVWQTNALAESSRAARRGGTDFLARAAENLRRARRLPPGPERNELRQIAIALRWLAAHPLSPSRQALLHEMLERDPRDAAP
jgi:hypothetical protein